MASIIRNTAFEPLITGGLLLALTRGSPELRERILSPLAKLPFKVDATTVVTTLKWLLGLGIARRVNQLLNTFAKNKWTVNDGGRPWDWPNEIAVVTGGSGGIGSEIVKNLADKGVTVAIVDLMPPPESLKAYRNVHFYKTDITSITAVTDTANAIKRDLGNTTILCNNAGLGGKGAILDVSNDYLEKIFHINLISMWYTVKAFLPGMIQERKGHIVTTASMASYTAVAGMVDYCATKAGAMSFHEGLNQELKFRYKAPFVKTTAVHPYWVQTAMMKNWETGIKSANAPVMTPQYVGKQIADAIFTKQSQHLILPPSPMLNFVSGLRGWPLWMLEAVNDTQEAAGR